jgi:organic radical activating enzyme
MRIRGTKSMNKFFMRFFEPGWRMMGAKFMSATGCKFHCSRCDQPLKRTHAAHVPKGSKAGSSRVIE